jgi:hypothetical protein
VRILVIILLLLNCSNVFPQQVNDDEEEFGASNLEELSQDEETESENDYDLQLLANLRKHPLNINGEEIQELPILDPLLVLNLSSYRNLLGDIIDIHELQAIPGFTSDIIKKIMPFVEVRKNVASAETLRTRITKGDHTVLLRPVITPEIAEGFKTSASSRFIGSRPAIFARYKYQYKNLLQFGFVADKDAGEKLFADGSFPDFVSFHLFVRQLGIIRSLAVGDYTINFGQGLIHWQSQAFHKSAAVISIKRQSETLRPYQSAGEYNFHRGVAATLQKRNLQFTFFTSVRKLSANTAVNEEGDQVITSIQTSGLHRTASEMEDRSCAKMFAAGTIIKKIFHRGHVALNAVKVLYSIPILKDGKPYNLFALRGDDFFNYSLDYNYTYRNFHFFGEVAADKNFHPASVSGVMSSLGASLDLAVLYRRIPASYQTVYGNAFTENTLPVNESGFYTGISIKPKSGWRIDLYGDLFSFPWLKYRLNAPMDGLQYLVQVTYKAGKQTEIYSRYRYRMKPLNIEDDEETIPGLQLIRNWRSQISHQLNRTILLRSRVELASFDHLLLKFPQSGYLFSVDFIYKPYTFWLSGNVRIQAFEADSYETRIYAYENDLLYVSSTPSFYNNGVRYYVNLKGKVRVKLLNNSLLTFSLKAASTVYTNISMIGTGVSKVSGNRISTLKLQFFLTK